MPRVWGKLALFVLPLVFANLDARAQLDGVAGRWLTEDGKGVIDIARCGESICGKIDWYKRPIGDNPREVDFRNPDPGRRDRHLCGLQILYGFRAMPGGRGWEEGHIYSPEEGDTYHANIVVVDATHIRLRGYIGIPLLGETQVWSRAAAGHEKCQ